MSNMMPNSQLFQELESGLLLNQGHFTLSNGIKVDPTPKEERLLGGVISRDAVIQIFGKVKEGASSLMTLPDSIQKVASCELIREQIQSLIEYTQELITESEVQIEKTKADIDKTSRGLIDLHNQLSARKRQLDESNARFRGMSTEIQQLKADIATSRAETARAEIALKRAKKKQNKKKLSKLGRHPKRLFHAAASGFSSEHIGHYRRQVAAKQQAQANLQNKQRAIVGQIEGQKAFIAGLEADIARTTKEEAALEGTLKSLGSQLTERSNVKVQLQEIQMGYKFLDFDVSVIRDMVEAGIEGGLIEVFIDGVGNARTAFLAAHPS